MEMLRNKLERVDARVAELLKSETVQAKLRRFEWRVEGVRYANFVFSVSVLCCLVAQREEIQRVDQPLVLYVVSIVLGIIGYDTGRRHSIFDGPTEES